MLLEKVKKHIESAESDMSKEELEMFKLLIQTVEKFKEDIELKDDLIVNLRESNRQYQTAFDSLVEKNKQLEIEKEKLRMYIISEF